MWTNDFLCEKETAWLAHFFEPLTIVKDGQRVQPPSAPEQTRPHCCFLNTVIFYKQPFTENDGGYAEWGRAETEWNLLGERWTDEDCGWRALAPLVQHESEFWELTGGEVVHAHGQWFLKWHARRLGENDYRLSQRAARKAKAAA